jgi:formylglycine-generating enzyme required for sulfatase activity
MRSRHASSHPGRPARTALLAVLAAGALVAPERPLHAEESAPPDAAQEVERLRRDMELAFLDVQKDHGRVRAAEWAKTPFGDAFSAALTAFVKDARERAEPRTAKQDVDDAVAALVAMQDKKTEPPLTRTSMVVVLAETSRAARADKNAAPRDLYVAAAGTVFGTAKPEDVWDTCFIALPLVESYRQAQKKLADAQARAVPQPPGTAPPAKVQEREVKGIDEMILTERARPWLGPWTGWITDISESKNKRQQRTVKPVWVDRYETTCAQYKAFVDALPAAGRKAMLPQGWSLDDFDAAQMPVGKELHPVTGVTWRQAQSYAESQGKRLPTCDEWERAAAGGDKEARTFPWGGSEDGKDWAHLGVEPKGTFPVDAFPDDVTPDGIVGMAGNVTELVSTYSDRTEVGKSGPDKGKQVLVCGGSYTARASECATSWRWVADADGASPSVGFRCVMDEAEYKKRHR